MMRPLSSMVAASMAKGLYSTSSSGELGSAVFESWTMVNGGREKAARPKAVRWKIDDEFMSSSSKKKNRSGGYAHTHTLQKELMSLMMSSGDIGVSAFPEGESIFAWIGTIEGGKGTMYEGLSYKLSLRFPLDYPFKPPQVKFETMCFHPNVDQFGNICLDILQDKWSSAYDCRTILLSIQSLLGEPNTESPLNSYAATLWQKKEDYKKMVHKHYFDGEAIES
ncbi:hypothetical protein RHGRI_027437 [Rhododendron griersonianum]|uniref:E2 ubiquitin-conjugating enzyme n=1 Tax=Rhododendron griersonianum TaxID=479676 RepID=A0AAV6J0V9_9ERIC|nr:hypothetical protein RHGRI_027437 [Rhododendron griersonianum]